MAERPDYDSAWKDALGAYFPDFMRMLRPSIYACIDWTHPPKYLDKELQALMRSTARGRRHVDKLVSVHLLDGQEIVLLIHVEVQTRYDPQFAARMLDYHFRLKSRYPDDRLLNLAVLTEPGRTPPAQASEQMSYAYEFGGCGLEFTFPALRLEWWRPRIAELREQAPHNPFAVIVLAQLEATALRETPDRLLRKIELVRSLAQWGFERDNRLKLFRVIDAMLHLPDDLESAFDDAVVQIEKEQQVSYITSIERVRSKRERAQGLEEGMQKGMQQGQIELLRLQLTGKFGPLPDWASARMADADEAQLNQWALRILEAPRIEDVFI